MPPRTRPAEQRLPAMWREQQAAANQATAQQVITDPTQTHGDPAHGYAVVVIGYLGTICGINAYGIASYKSGSWTQL